MLKIISEFDLFDMIIFSMQGFNVGYKRLTITVIDPDIAVVFFPNVPYWEEERNTLKNGLKQ